MKYCYIDEKQTRGWICLWDSKHTDYDVGSSGNKTNVIEHVARACKKYDISVWGFYYSLWDADI